MVERQPPDSGSLKVADSISADACRKARIVAQQKRFFDLVVTSPLCDECRWNYIVKPRMSGFESRRLHKFCGAVAQLVEQDVSSPLSSQKVHSVLSQNWVRARPACWSRRKSESLPLAFSPSLQARIRAYPQSGGSYGKEKTI